MGLFQKSTFKETVFFKDSNYAEKELEQINQLLSKGKDAKLEQKAKLISCGIEGEKNIRFELLNSHMPMYILHDIYLKDGDLSAQIDYIILTRKKIFIVECKNLLGTITIDSNGNFTREYMFNGRKIKEGIYSPITQNKRHLDLIKQIREKELGPLGKKVFNSVFYDEYCSLVVLANPKSILNSRYAKKEIKDKVIKADQLIQYIENETKKEKNNYSEKELINLSNWFMKHHQERELPNFKFNIEENKNNTIDKESLNNELKKYRLQMSQFQNIKPYFIFTNQQLETLVKLLPITIEELKKINGFAEVKCEKYGKDIIDIIKKYKK